MHGPVELLITSPDGSARVVVVASPVTVGREQCDVVVDDPALSRRHLQLAPDGDAVVVSDLGSANGTWVDGQRLGSPRTVRAGEQVVAGDTTLVVLARVAPGGGPSGDGVIGHDRSPVTVIEQGRHAAAVAPWIRSRAAAAWARLVELAPEQRRGAPTIRLVDPYPDPADPTRAVAEGTVIDPDRHEVWMVVGATAAPDEPAYALALLVAAETAPDPEVALLFAGYGLHLAGVPSTDDAVRAAGVVRPSVATGEPRLAGAVSFVRSLITRAGDDVMRSTLARLGPGRVDAVLLETYGAGLASLERRWARSVAANAVDVPPRQFLSLSLHHLRPYRWQQIEVFALMLLGLAFTVTFPFVTRRLFDEAIPSGELAQVMGLLGVLGVAFVVSIVAGVRQAYLSATISGSVVRDLQQAMFDRLQVLPQAWYDEHDQGDVLTRVVRDVGAVEGALTQVFAQGILQALTLVVSATIMIVMSPLLGAIVLVAAPIVAVIYRTMGSGARARSTLVQEEASVQMGVVAENHGAHQVVTSFGLAGRERERFAPPAAHMLPSQWRRGFYKGMFVNMVMLVLRLVVLGLGSWLILHDRFTIGGLVAFLSIMGEVLGPVTVLTQLGQGMQRAAGPLVRVREVLDAPVEDEHADRPDLPRLAREIRFDDVSFAYPGGHVVLDHVQLVVDAGSKVAIVGPSGSGKSTLLRLLMRLYEPSGGSVSFDGVDVAAANVASLRAQLGVVFQEPLLFDSTVRDNVALGRRGATDEQVSAAMRSAEVDEFLGRLPRGADTLVGERGGALSGGQRQRVSIARALVRDPAVLVLDEATSALDAVTERNLSATFERIGQGRTIISVTHRLASVVGYDRIVVLDGGRVVETGTHRDLLAAGGLYAGLWAEQHGAETEPAGVLPAPPATAIDAARMTGLTRAAPAPTTREDTT